MTILLALGRFLGAHYQDLAASNQHRQCQCRTRNPRLGLHVRDCHAGDCVDFLLVGTFLPNSRHLFQRNGTETWYCRERHWLHLPSDVLELLIQVEGNSACLQEAVRNSQRSRAMVNWLRMLIVIRAKAVSCSRSIFQENEA